jgi:L-ascorbate metabolism protein UlaG (beta-lactamase superfamily)
MRRVRFAIPAVLLLSMLAGCSAVVSTGSAIVRNVDALFRSPRALESRITDPYRPDARLVITWIGHATMLIQMDDRFVLTDPNLTATVGQFSKRLVEPGIDPADLPVLDAVLISHMHIDHLSLGSLDLIVRKTRQIIVPRKGLVYLPEYEIPMRELGAWQHRDAGGMRITAVPVRHNGWRYAVDSWMDSSATGYIIDYRGMRVYFGGDTGYDDSLFVRTGRRYPGIDVALLPIAPIHPREYSAGRHTDPAGALHIARDLGAKTMIPMHYDTFQESLDRPGEARELADSLASVQNGRTPRMLVPRIGEQVVCIPGPPGVAPPDTTR